MPELVGYFLLFAGVGAAFVLVNLTIGKFIRPAKMDAEKATIYECGEPTIGSAWVQFDLRFYVVALLFVIFDVEMAFFFPWAVVFGKANRLADPRLPAEQRAQLTAEMTDFAAPQSGAPESPRPPSTQRPLVESTTAARNLSVVAFFDILVFFGVLLVGYAYLWRRGDLDWVRSLASQRAEEAAASQDRRRELLILTKD